MTQEKYDIAIAGGGLAALSAAALLTDAGYKTLVVEKLPLLGGRFSTVEYKGYKITTGATWIAAEGPLRQTFQDVGAEFEVRCPEPQSHYWIDGKYHELAYSGRLRFLLSQASQDKDEIDRLMAGFIRGLRWRQPCKDVSLQEWLSQYTTNRTIYSVFNSMTTSWQGVNIDELSAHEYFSMLKEAPKVRAFGYPPGGNISLVDSLAKAIRARGGTIWTRSRVQRIIVEKGIAKGMYVEGPEGAVTIEAKAVISDVGPRKTVELADIKSLDPIYAKEVEEKATYEHMVMFAIVSDKPLVEHPGALLLTGTRRAGVALCPTLTCPEWAPKGKHLLLVYGVPVSNVVPLKADQELQMVLQDIEDIFPLFRQGAGEILKASCWTKEWPTARAFPGFDLGLRTAVENLYVVGDGVIPEGWTGVSGVALSGRMVTEDIKKQITK